jgi:glycosyltransferase involved in cell wall biosynthesis
MDKVFIFSDCYIYGGSERLIVFLVGNREVNKDHRVIFGYRKFEAYEKGLFHDLTRFGIEAETHPFFLMANDDFFHKINLKSISPLRKIFIKLPFYILQKVGVYFLFNFFVFVRYLKKTKPDIIHINNGGYPGALRCNHLLLAAKFCGIKPIVYQVNNIAVKGKGAFAGWYNRVVDRTVSYFITASEMAREALIRERQFNPAKMATIPNAVFDQIILADREEILKLWNLSPDTFLLVQVAFLTRRKGQVNLLKAIHAIKKEDASGLSKRIKLILVGDGEDEPVLKDFVREHGLADSVIFAGYRDNAADYINASDIFVLPSIASEDMPLAMLEAMQMGKPIIASKFAGIAEAITDGEEGILLQLDPVTMPQQLQTAINSIFLEAGKGIRLGVNASRKFQERFSTGVYGKRINNLYSKVLDGEKIK